MKKTNSKLGTPDNPQLTAWLRDDNALYEAVVDKIGDVTVKKTMPIPAEVFAEIATDYFNSDAKKDWNLVIIGNMRAGKSNVEYTLLDTWEVDTDPVLDKKHEVSDALWKSATVEEIESVKAGVDELRQIIALSEEGGRIDGSDSE